jgi:hypothetical protein
MQAIPFQNVIRNLMYALVCIRLNITHAMGVVNQFMASLGQSHWIVVKRIFHHLKSTMDFGMCLKKNMKDVIMGKVHSNKDVDCSQGQVHFEKNVSHN